MQSAAPREAQPEADRASGAAPAYYSCALNSLVHVFMYMYYALSMVLGKDPARRRKYLWWSRYLTQFQMFQFVTNMVQVRSPAPPPGLLIPLTAARKPSAASCPPPPPPGLAAA